ncbi:MAG: imidazole glycerol phosphate synthase cyclase subunit [Pseudomonadota bacterium]
MLKTRVIPILLWKDFGLVKGVGFDSWRRVGTVLPAIKVYNRRDVDELILLDVVATVEDQEPDYEEIEALSSECFVPLTYGGGIKSLQMITNILRAGADKVAINTAAYIDPELIRKASRRFGVQCIIVSIDAKMNESGVYECFSHSATKATGKELVEWAKECESLGAGELLVTNIDRDGTMDGYDLKMIELVSSAVSIPVIAAGGAGSAEHMLQALKKGKADAVAAASIFHFTHQTPAEMKKHLSDNGISVRNVNIQK